MNTEEILKRLRGERDRLDRAIGALEGQAKVGRPRSAAKRSGGGITAAGRKKLSDMMKARWAARRAQAGRRPSKKK